MRREGWNAGQVRLWLELAGAGAWSRSRWLPAVHDDQAVLAGLDHLWREARPALPRGIRIMQVGVTLFDLTRASARQLDMLIDDEAVRPAPVRRHRLHRVELDMLIDDEAVRLRWEKATEAVDTLNRKYGRTLVSVGPWTPPPGGYAGGKISYTRIPSAEDFW